jgi:3-oxoacyl-[acyl-carrier protein] reductase
VNHGIAFDGLLATQDPANISQVISSNLTSSLMLAKEYIRARLKIRTSGNIVFITSIIASRGYSGLASYSASKAGLEGAARSLARELGPKGFRVNCVAPGYFDSELSSSLDENKRNQIVRRTPLGRLAELSDITPAIEFLISEDASFITGNVITIDGGISV